MHTCWCMCCCTLILLHLPLPCYMLVLLLLQLLFLLLLLQLQLLQSAADVLLLLLKKRDAVGLALLHRLIQFHCELLMLRSHLGSCGIMLLAWHKLPCHMVYNRSKPTKIQHDTYHTSLQSLEGPGRNKDTAGRRRQVVLSCKVSETSVMAAVVTGSQGAFSQVGRTTVWCK
jgi:hypothetical protein